MDYTARLTELAREKQEALARMARYIHLEDWMSVETCATRLYAMDAKILIYESLKQNADDPSR